MPVAPFAIMAGPANVWLAAVGTAFPLIDDPPGGSWISLGQTEGGIEVVHNETIEELRSDQAIGPLKMLRTEEGWTISFELVEVTLERYAMILNNATVTDTAPGAEVGFRSLPLRQGYDVAQWAILCRGGSPYGNWNLQYQVPVVSQVGEPTISFMRTDKSTLSCSFSALEDPAAATPALKFGTLIAQDQ